MIFTLPTKRDKKEASLTPTEAHGAYKCNYKCHLWMSTEWAKMLYQLQFTSQNLIQQKQSTLTTAYNYRIAECLISIIPQLRVIIFKSKMVLCLWLYSCSVLLSKLWIVTILSAFLVFHSKYLFVSRKLLLDYLFFFHLTCSQVSCIWQQDSYISER